MNVDLQVIDGVPSVDAELTFSRSRAVDKDRSGRVVIRGEEHRPISGKSEQNRPFKKQTKNIDLHVDKHNQNR